MDKHTPGPWEENCETEYVPAQVWAEGRQLAEVYGECREARAANARLIAAAPRRKRGNRKLVCSGCCSLPKSFRPRWGNSSAPR